MVNAKYSLTWLSEEWQARTLYALAGGLFASLGIGWSDVYRSDPFYGYQGAALADRITKIENKLPVKFPPPEWDTAYQVWKTGVMGEINSIRASDRYVLETLKELTTECDVRGAEVSQVVFAVKRNAQQIEDIWKLINNKGEK